MKIHNYLLSKDICNKLIEQVLLLEAGESRGLSPYSRYKQVQIESGDRNGVSPFISQTHGGLKESTAVKDLKLFKDQREYLILKGYEGHKESGYTNYVSKEIDNLVPDNLFAYFNMDKSDCIVDIKKFMPGKIHIPHKDYYINYKYNLVDINGTLEFVEKKNSDTQNKNVIRLWITLTEPRFGHVLIVENNVLYWLEQGTVVTWEPEELHTAANLGFEDRYIMVITGSIRNQER